MIKDSYPLQRFEQQQIKKEKYSYLQALKIVKLLYQEAKDLGVIQKIPQLDGIETDIKVARILASLKKND